MTTWLKDDNGNRCSVEDLTLLTARISAECIVWTGYRDAKGYGRVWSNNRYALAHRVSYEINAGPIPANLCVLHKCDNPSCINPRHLTIGSQRDNIRDRDQKKRTARGEENGRAKLSDSNVRDIRQSGETMRVIAARFGISCSRVSDIKNLKSWSHV